MNAKNIATLYGTFRKQDKIERIFMHDDKFIVEAYPEGEDADDRAYSSYYMFEPSTKSFERYTPQNISIKETDRLLESASHPLSF